jgi:hypothetical protein
VPEHVDDVALVARREVAGRPGEIAVEIGRASCRERVFFDV